VSNRTRGSEEEDLDRDRETRMQRKHHDKEDLARLCFRGAKHRVQIAQKEERREREAQRNEDVVENCSSTLSAFHPKSPSTPTRVAKKISRLTSHRTPTHKRHHNPHQIRIPIKTTTLQQIRALTPIPLQHRPQRHRHRTRVPIHQARRAAQQLEVIAKLADALLTQILVNRPREKQDHHHRRRNPHGAVQIGISLQDVEEVGARVYGGGAAAQDFVGVDVEGLRVEREGPKVVFARGGGGVCGAGQEGGRVGLDFGGAARGLRVEVCSNQYAPKMVG
jgi:hypothetical protein